MKVIGKYEKLDIYTPRNPTQSHYYKCVSNHYEELAGIWDDVYQRQYGYWRPFIIDVIYKFIDCGDPQNGFARVKCKDCNHEYLLTFSCKSRYFCPSCHQRRVLEFGEYLYEEVLKQVPHRQWVFSIPKRLRPYFMYDRKLLSKLSKCAWKVLSDYLKCSVSEDDATPGAVISVQTFGDFLNFNSHLHIIATDGCFNGDGFIFGSQPNSSDLVKPFRDEVLKMLKKEGKINDAIIENMLSWHHSGFNIYCGPAIYPDEKDVIERLSQYIVRAPISQERMIYIPEDESRDGNAQVIYKDKSGIVSQTFDALDWLAKLITHIPDKGEQLVRYYGYYSNKSRGMRKKLEKDNSVPALVSTSTSKKTFRKKWAELIMKVYNVDPLICPKCSGQMRIVGFIEDTETINKILKHLNRLHPQSQAPPKRDKSSIVKHIEEIKYDCDFSQETFYDDDI